MSEEKLVDTTGKPLSIEQPTLVGSPPFALSNDDVKSPFKNLLVLAVSLTVTYAPVIVGAIPLTSWGGILVAGGLMTAINLARKYLTDTRTVN